MAKQTKAKSSIIYAGPSLIDGQPIVCIAIIKSGNVKTGDMVQTHIIRSDISPLNASKSGQDYSICGNCKHRGQSTDDPKKKQAKKRTCYVNLGQGPTIVFKALQRGVYEVASTREERARIGASRMVRMGTYGDPAAVPREVWDDLLSDSVGHTGYTHNARFQNGINELCMVSADNESDTINATKSGYRSFRVIPVSTYEQLGKGSLMNNEILCPASKEAGFKSTCDKCGLCAGNTIKAKSIAIVAHGASRNYVQ